MPTRRSRTSRTTRARTSSWPYRRSSSSCPPLLFFVVVLQDVNLHPPASVTCSTTFSRYLYTGCRERGESAQTRARPLTCSCTAPHAPARREARENTRIPSRTPLPAAFVSRRPCDESTCRAAPGSSRPPSRSWRNTCPSSLEAHRAAPRPSRKSNRSRLSTALNLARDVAHRHLG